MLSSPSHVAVSVEPNRKDVMPRHSSTMQELNDSNHLPQVAIAPTHSTQKAANVSLRQRLAMRKNKMKEIISKMDYTALMVVDGILNRKKSRPFERPLQWVNCISSFGTCSHPHKCSHTSNLWRRLRCRCSCGDSRGIRDSTHRTYIRRSRFRSHTHRRKLL